MRQPTSEKQTTRASHSSRLTTAQRRAVSPHTPATPDSEAIAEHIKGFEYKSRYSKRVLSKYENLCRGDD